MNVTENNDLWRKPIQVLPFRQAFPELGTNEQYNEKKVIVSLDHAKLFGVLPTKTPVVAHEEAFNVFTTAVSRMWGNKEPTVTVTSLHGGGMMQVMAEMPQYEIRFNDQDVSHLRAYLDNSYVRTTSLFSLKIGGFRHECQNSMMFGTNLTGATARELVENWSVSGMESLIERELTRAIDISEYWQVFAEHQVDFKTAQELVKKSIRAKLLSNVLLEEMFPKTLWEFYNDLTSEISHGILTAAERIRFSNIIGAIFYGKQSSLRKIPELVDVNKHLRAVDAALAKKRSRLAVDTSDDLAEAA